ncbi:MAG TPA: hypothetical protein VFV38_17600 [Ktedonobacteraceae bacterium]|nr:hypothetical protein [Ktedonobacteraceae bacterium]
MGAAHYPWVPDYIEETRRLGASRRINPNLDLSLLTRTSRIILAHPKAIAQNWSTLQPPARCKKHLEQHDLVSYARLALDPLHDEQRAGPCLFKLWELLPQDQAESIQEMEGQVPLCLRRIGFHSIPVYAVWRARNSLGRSIYPGPAPDRVLADSGRWRRRKRASQTQAPGGTGQTRSDACAIL